MKMNDRGVLQLWNLRESFIVGESPADLTKRPPLIVSRRLVLHYE